MIQHSQIPQHRRVPAAPGQALGCRIEPVSGEGERGQIMWAPEGGAPWVILYDSCKVKKASKRHVRKHYQLEVRRARTER